MHGSRKGIKIRMDYYKIDGVNDGSRVSIVYQMKEGEERDKMVVFVLLGGRKHGGGGRFCGRRRLG